jgi:hypothetical protein
MYKQLDEIRSKTNVPSGDSDSWVNQKPMATSAMAVKTLGSRMSCSQARRRDEFVGSVMVAGLVVTLV